MRQRVTIREVAERAGCGIATVSRVLNGSGPASAESRDRVLAAATALRFQFNEVGRSLQSQRSRTLGVVVPSLSNPVFAAAIEGIQETAAARGYQILLGWSGYEAETEANAVRTLAGKQVDGVVLTVCDPDDSAAIEALGRASIPYCLIFNQPGRPRPSVGVDNVAAAAAAGDAVLAAGHRELAFVAVEFHASERSRLRYRGLCAAAAAAGADAPTLAEIGDADNLGARLGAMLAARPGLTAVLASNDMLALGCIRALKRLGRSVPEDISVVGFDGIAMADLVEPGLATLATPNRQMGARAAELVIDAVREGATLEACPHFLPFEFQLRGSLGLCRTRTAEARPVARSSA